MLCIQRRGADGKVQRRLAMSILGVDVSAGGREHRHNCRCRCVCIRAVTARAREVQRCSCRASGDVAVRCVGARRTLVAAQGPSAGPEPTAMDLRFDFEVRYCGRTSVARGVSGAFLKRSLSLILTRELAELLKAAPDSHGRVAKLCAVSAPIDKACRSRQPEAPSIAGRVIARRLQSLHRATAVLLRAYSPMLLAEVLQLDPDRVWREEEPRVARLLEAGDARSGVLYLVDERWLATWRAWAFWSPPKPSDGVPETKGGDPELPPSAPGPLSSSRLKSDGLKLGSDYRAIGPSLYAYLVLCHGGGGARLPRARGAVDLYALPAEQAQWVGGRVVGAFVWGRARLRREPSADIRGLARSPPPKRIPEPGADVRAREARAYHALEL